jgi:alpha-D-ribose 1-methylphosphonate 5-triphosphate synthase subunit PhnH
MIVTAELRETAFDPLAGAQAVFRRLLEATARPGLVVPLGPVPLVVPPARVRPACVLLLALMDREVTFAVVGTDAETVREYLRFNTGAHATAVSGADFVLVTASGRDWSAAQRGALDASHERATVVLTPSHVGGAPGGADVTLWLTGPGIVGEAALPLRGLKIFDLAPLVDHPEFPRGVDVWFAGADGHLAVVPRSTRCRFGGA